MKRVINESNLKRGFMFSNLRNRFGKRGQFFLLAAVVISVVVLSLGITSNQARINKEPKSFYDDAKNIEEETDAVVDYLIYSPSPTVNIQTFIDDIAQNLRDGNTNIELVVLYGTSLEVTIQNHGVSDIGYKCGSSGSFVTIEGRKYEQTVDEGDGFGTTTEGSLGPVQIGSCSGSSEEVIIKLNEEEHLVSFSEDVKVIFLKKKEAGGEAYVSI